MRYSIIIPLYNGAKHISGTLDTVLAQTYKDYEIVMVNDGSPDGVGEVVKKYILDHPGVKYIYLEQKNKGLGGARNTAIKQASGEIIAILDQDDIWYPEKLQETERIFSNYPEMDYVGHHEAVRHNGVIERIAYYGPVKKDLFRQLLFENDCFSTSASCFKKSVVDRVGLFSEDQKMMHFVEDYDYWLRMAAAGCRFHIIDKVLGEYVLHDDNYSINSLRLMYRHEANAVSQNWKKYPGKKPGDRIRYYGRLAKILYASLRSRV